MLWFSLVVWYSPCCDVDCDIGCDDQCSCDHLQNKSSSLEFDVQEAPQKNQYHHDIWYDCDEFVWGQVHNIYK